MLERTGQINARFAGGTLKSEELTAALLALGLEQRQITLVMRADPGEYRPSEPEPGLVSRLLRLLGGTKAATVGPVPDALAMIYLSNESASAESIQEALHRFGATRVDYYPAGQVGADRPAGEDAALFSAAFPNSEQRRGAPNGVASGEAAKTP